MTNAQNDARYLAVGRMIYPKKNPDHDDELKRANKKKNGHPYRYAESTILALATMRAFCGLSYRILEGFATEALGTEYVPSFSQIQKRMKTVKVSIKDDLITAQGKKSALHLAPDGTGLSPSKRSEYIRYRHKVQHGFIRFVIVVDTDTREILSFSVTDERIGEAPQFEELTCTALENCGIDVADRINQAEKSNEDQSACQKADDPEHPIADSQKDEDDMQEYQSLNNELLDELKIVVRADGGFDSRKIFALCKKLKIKPCIRIKHNANTRSDGVSRDRTLAAIDQLGGGVSDPKKFAHLTKEEREANRKVWKKRVQYGKRWIVEIVISSIKRLFGDSVSAVTWENIIQEINLKVHIYNKMLQVQRRAIA